jgi:cytochrome P450
MRQLGLLLMRTLRRFSMAAAAGEPELRASVTLRPRDGLRLRVERRSAREGDEVAAAE